MIKLIKNNRGIALLLTILIISLILSATLQFNTSMRTDLYASANLRDGVKLTYTARSVLNLTRAVLVLDAQESEFDSKHENWMKLPAISEYSSYLFSGDRVALQLFDHSGKIQINALVYSENEAIRDKQKNILKRFFQLEEFGLEPEQAEHIVEALIDWIDEDDEVTGFGGAENSYYQSLEKPYSCKNGPMEFIEELQLVKGITKKLFYGTDEQPGISQYLTSHGIDGKININTAEPLTLLVLSDQLNREIVDDMIVYRDDENNDFASSNWYKNVPAFPGDITIDPDLITVSSTYFEVRADAFIGAMSKTVTGIIRREKNNTDIISWKIE